MLVLHNFLSFSSPAIFRRSVVVFLTTYFSSQQDGLIGKKEFLFSTSQSSLLTKMLAKTAEEEKKRLKNGKLDSFVFAKILIYENIGQRN